MKDALRAHQYTEAGVKSRVDKRIYVLTQWSTQKI